MGKYPVNKESLSNKGKQGKDIIICITIQAKLRNTRSLTKPAKLQACFNSNIQSSGLIHCRSLYTNFSVSK